MQFLAHKLVNFASIVNWEFHCIIFKNYWNFDLECKQGNHKTAFQAQNITGAIEKQASGLQNPYLFSDQASNKLNSSLLWLEGQQKSFLKVNYNLQITLSFLFICNWNNKYIHKLPWFPQKPDPIPDQDGQSLYLFSDRNGAAHTNMAYMREYSHPGGEQK